MDNDYEFYNKIFHDSHYQEICDMFGLEPESDSEPKPEQSTMKEMKRKKGMYNNNNKFKVRKDSQLFFTIPVNMIIASCESGWVNLLVYLILFKHKSLTNTIDVTKKMIGQWAGIKKNILKTVNKILYDLFEAKTINLIDFNITLDTPFSIKLLNVYKKPYTYIKLILFDILNDGGNGIMFCIYCVLCAKSYYNTKGKNTWRQCFMSEEKIAKTLNISRNTATKYLNLLKYKGYINISPLIRESPTKYYCKCYTLFYPESRYYISTQDKNNLLDDIKLITKNHYKEYPLLNSFRYMVNLYPSQYPVEISGLSAQVVRKFFIDCKRINEANEADEIDKLYQDQFFDFNKEEIDNMCDDINYHCRSYFDFKIKICENYDDVFNNLTYHLSETKIQIITINSWNFHISKALNDTLKNKPDLKIIILNLGSHINFNKYDLVIKTIIDDDGIRSCDFNAENIVG